MSESGIEQRGHNAKDYKVWVSATLNFTDCVEELRHSILDVAVPMLRVPIRPGRNITSIIEVAARNLLLKFQGKHSAREFQDRLNRALAEAQPFDAPLQVDEVE